MDDPQQLLPKITVAGFVWYKEADYQRLKSLFTDGHKLPPTFLMWQDKAEQGRKRHVRSGGIAVKAYIDPDTFPAWCSARGLNIDAKARTAFANEEAHRVAIEMQRQG